MTYPVETVTITLYTPIKDAAGNEITQLSMREPKVFDRIRQSYLKGMPEENEADMIAGLCEVHPEIIKNLTTADYRQLEDQFIVFTAPPSARAEARKALASMRADMREAAMTQHLASGIFSAE
ncbi:phage tail assembly protein [Lelliottia amnigena]|uniref:phage tail assembly protein n=1 Tax=Lelliottia amnigena TaxID=61646 RepID=UPI00192C0A23|nr:phage tail assembly protein [Lelliottia amnigena]MBL5920586.1 phage tail assembly protein [Lelliottia amnigena]